MPIVDRLEFPRKHKLKDTVLLIALAAAILGILVTRCGNAARKERILIHSVFIEEFDRQYLRLGYEIENKGASEERVSLLARVYDSEGAEIASIFFAEDLKAGSREFKSKVIDKLERPLREGEKPHRATLELRNRDIFSY
ncbi:MAG: hypothetical protein K0B87_08685 [Candidatus Syntrophosphaera sp.]|nr:hypothetical protein [Candidatus Syntrophosphaera sp.]